MTQAGCGSVDFESSIRDSLADTEGLLIMNTNILVCDDEASVRKAVSATLEMDNHHVDTAADGNEALQMIRAQPGRYRLVLTDHQMPVLDGLGLVRSLHDDGFAGKIVILSGRLDNSDFAAYTALAVDAVIFKPFDFVELRKTVNSLLSPHTVQRSVSYW